jgi:single-stranded-DNA-specific exonuclease
MALATVVDVCPVDGENRAIVARGLSAFAECAPPGLIELARCAGQDPSNLSVFSFGFILGPRLNAAGRLDSPKLAAALITTKDKKKISEITSMLENLNRRRKTLVRKAAEQAVARVDSGECPGPIIALHDGSWHEGVIGLIASSLTDTYKRPALVATDAGDGFVKGSGRTSGTFDLLGALRTSDGALTGYGGHSAAVGFKLRQDDFPQFVHDLESSNSCDFDDERFTPVLQMDGAIKLSELGEHEVEELEKTQPWGKGNEAPAFLIEGLNVTECDTMGDGSHIRLKLRQGRKSMSAVGFGFNRDGIFLTQVTGKADVAVVPEINEFRGKREIRLRLKDIKFT